VLRLRRGAPRGSYKSTDTRADTIADTSPVGLTHIRTDASTDASADTSADARTDASADTSADASADTTTDTRTVASADTRTVASTDGSSDYGHSILCRRQFHLERWVRWLRYVLAGLAQPRLVLAGCLFQRDPCRRHMLPVWILRGTTDSGAAIVTTDTGAATESVRMGEAWRWRVFLRWDIELQPGSFCERGDAGGSSGSMRNGARVHWFELRLVGLRYDHRLWQL